MYMSPQTAQRSIQLMCLAGFPNCISLLTRHSKRQLPSDGREHTVTRKSVEPNWGFWGNLGFSSDCGPNQPTQRKSVTRGAIPALTQRSSHPRTKPPTDLYFSTCGALRWSWVSWVMDSGNKCALHMQRKGGPAESGHLQSLTMRRFSPASFPRLQKPNVSCKHQFSVLMWGLFISFGLTPQRSRHVHQRSSSIFCLDWPVSDVGPTALLICAS